MADVRDELARASLAVAEYFHSGDYAAAVVSGGSRQLSHSLLALGWHARYGSEKMRRVYVLDAEANRMLYKHARENPPDAEGFRKWMERNAPGLAAIRAEPLLFVDDYALQAAKYRELRVILPRLHGFTQVDFAFFAAGEDTELGRDAFVGVRSDDAVGELYRIGQHIQGKEEARELLDGIAESAANLRREAISEVRDIGRRMK